jgi:hypothetical protein
MLAAMHLELDFEEAEMRRLLSKLVPDGDIANVSEPEFVHTVGAAYAALREMDRAAAAGSHLINMARDAEDATSLQNALVEAIGWIQSANNRVAMPLA